MKISIIVFTLYMLTLGLVDHIDTKYQQQVNLNKHNTACRSCPLIVKAMEKQRHEYARNTQQ